MVFPFMSSFLICQSSSACCTHNTSQYFNDLLLAGLNKLGVGVWRNGKGCGSLKLLLLFIRSEA